MNEHAKTMKKNTWTQMVKNNDESLYTYRAKHW